VYRKENKVRRYNADKHCGLGVVSNTGKKKTICSTCATKIKFKRLVKLKTHLPIFKPNGNRQYGLFATKKYQHGEFITSYWGVKVYAKNRDKASDYVWNCSPGKIIDAKNSTSLAKFSNNGIRGVFYCNAKVKNKDGSKMFATRDIFPGEEIFWNYGKSFFNLHNIKKITKKMIDNNLVGDFLLRDCDNGKIGNKLKR